MAPRKVGVSQRKGDELATAQHDLMLAEQTLFRISDVTRSVRDRSHKIAEQDARISAIKSKIDTLTQTQRVVHTPTASFILGSISSNTIMPFSNVTVKREVLESVLSITGPGSQETPMDVDDDEGNNNDQVGSSINGPTDDQTCRGRQDSFDHQDQPMRGDHVTQQDQTDMGHLSQLESITSESQPKDHHQSTSTNDHQASCVQQNVADPEMSGDSTHQEKQDPEMSGDGTHQEKQDNINEVDDQAGTLDIDYVDGGRSGCILPQKTSVVGGDNNNDKDVRKSPSGAILQGSQCDWKLDHTICNEIYSFQLKDYNDLAFSQTNLEGPVEDESGGTTFHHQNALILQARAGHYEGQLKSLIEQQHRLVQSVSEGFHGDMQATVKHIAAFNKSVDDIRCLEVLLAEHQGYAKGARCIYLRYITKDDQKRIGLLEAKRLKHLTQLSQLLSTDPLLFKTTMVQQSVRNANGQISAVEEQQVVQDANTQISAVEDADAIPMEQQSVREVIAQICQAAIEGAINANTQISTVEEAIALEQQYIREVNAQISAIESAINKRKEELVELEAYADAFQRDIIRGTDDDDEDFIPVNDTDGVISDDRGAAPRQTLGRRKRQDSQNTRSIAEGKKKAESSAQGKKKVESSASAKDSLPTIQMLSMVRNPLATLQRKDEDERQADDDGLKALLAFLKTRDPSTIVYALRKNVRELVRFLPQAGIFTMDTIPLLFQSKRTKQVMCEYHRKGKDTTFKADSLIELVGMGFKGRVRVLKAGDNQAPEIEGHLHCGCPASEVALELFLWKTSQAFSSNPKIAGNAFQMTDLHMLKPSTRAFWNQSLRDYTGLRTEDFFGLDYGEPSYATRIALRQLHTQIERLKILGAPVDVTIKFEDRLDLSTGDEIVAYGLEVGEIATSSQHEELWKDIIQRQVAPLPMLAVDSD